MHQKPEESGPIFCRKKKETSRRTNRTQRGQQSEDRGSPHAAILAKFKASLANQRGRKALPDTVPEAAHKKARGVSGEVIKKTTAQNFGGETRRKNSKEVI